MYHKVDKEAKSRYWVSIHDFERQMSELKNKEVVSLYDYNPQNPFHVAITFDGVYENVYKYAFPILKKLKYPFHLFITSEFIGKDNAFDYAEPLTNFASFEQLREMAKCGAYLEWHTRTHPYFHSKMSAEQILLELTVPEDVKQLQPEGFRWFAFPYGVLDGELLKLLYEKFQGVVSVWQGGGGRYVPP